MDELVPYIEENIPLPANAREAMPELSPAQDLEMRANVIRFFSDATGVPISPTKENADQAKEIAKNMMNNPGVKLNLAQYPNETLAMLAGMVSQMNFSIVEELSELKMYVVNKLLAEIETSKDAKTRIAAIRSLGEVDGVDAFKKRSEVTHKHLTIEEVEKELLITLESLEDKVIDVEARTIVKAQTDATQ
jgi:hypothetical protein